MTINGARAIAAAGLVGAAIFAVALVAKVAAPHVAAAEIHDAIRSGYGIDVPARLLGGIVVAVDALACVFALFVRNRVGARGAIGLAAGLGVHHLVMWARGSSCGCFGAWAAVPKWLGVVATLELLAVALVARWHRLSTGSEWSRSGLVHTSAAGAIVVAVVAWVCASGAPPTGVEHRVRIAGVSNAYVFVFDPGCEHCIAAARELDFSSRTRRLVAVTHRDAQGTAEFAAKVGQSIDVVRIESADWVALLEGPPPAFGSVDEAGTFTRLAAIPTETKPG